MLKTTIALVSLQCSIECRTGCQLQNANAQVWLSGLDSISHFFYFWYSIQKRIKITLINNEFQLRIPSHECNTREYKNNISAFFADVRCFVTVKLVSQRAADISTGIVTIRVSTNDTEISPELSNKKRIRRWTNRDKRFEQLVEEEGRKREKQEGWSLWVYEQLVR